jgi:hypothetical protein
MPMKSCKVSLSTLHRLRGEMTELSHIDPRSTALLLIDPMGRWTAAEPVAECGCNHPLWRRPCSQ